MDMKGFAGVTICHVVLLLRSTVVVLVDRSPPVPHPPRPTLQAWHVTPSEPASPAGLSASGSRLCTVQSQIFVHLPIGNADQPLRCRDYGRTLKGTQQISLDAFSPSLTAHSEIGPLL